jgi:hypothetical protein
VPGGKSAPHWRGGHRRFVCAKEEPPDNALDGARQANAALLRRQGLVERIHEVAGPRGFREIFEELIRHGLVDEGELDRVLTAYAALDPRIVKAMGADRMPPRPLRVIGDDGLEDAP